MSGNSLFFLGILLPSKLEKSILEFKRDLADNFEARYALKAPSHITIAETFRLPPTETNILTKKLHTFFLQFKAFECEISDFGFFKNRSPTIFAKVRKSDSIGEIRRKLFWARKADGLLNKDAIPSSQLTPHITIAYRDLTIGNFQVAWEKYSKLKFEASFLIDKIHLLEHKGKWQSVAEFPLQGLGGQEPEQLSLFIA